MRCARLLCRHEAAYRCKAKLASGKVVEADLCAGHAFAFEDGLARNPHTLSGSRTPLAVDDRRAA